MPFTATMNTPGDLPDADTPPPVFNTAGEAWKYLAAERRAQEDDAWNANDQEAGGTPYSETVNTLAATALAAAKSDLFTTGTVYGGTPGYDGDHDLGIAYSVQEAEADDDVPAAYADQRGHDVTWMTASEREGA